MSLPFPDGPIDNDVFFHNEMVCIFRAAINTWECRRITAQNVNLQSGQPPTTKKHG